MWPTGQTIDNAVIDIRIQKCPLASGSKLALPHPSRSLEVHFVLLGKIIAYAVFQLKPYLLFHSKKISWINNLVFVHWNCVDFTYKNLGSLMKIYCNDNLGLISSQGQFMLSTVNCFKLMI